METILITGGAGFIGSELTRQAAKLARVVVLDKLTYAGFLGNLEGVIDDKDVFFVHGDIGDRELVLAMLKRFGVTKIMNLAAESHVDNSISGPAPFIETNIKGTFSLLEAAREYFAGLTDVGRSQFRFLHISTDEVFGELGDGGYFTEKTPYAPSSPYSASKASSDHLVRAWFKTYKLPVVLTNCSNNYGPRQFPEKLIPRMIDCALKGEPLPVYGKGENVRDWIHVEDHCAGLLLALKAGQIGGTYCLGGRSERKNIEVVRAICRILNELSPGEKAYENQISFVTDRAGHDWRYAIDDSLAESELGFRRRYQSFESGLTETVNGIWPIKCG